MYFSPSSYYTVNPNIGGKNVKKSAVPEIHGKIYGVYVSGMAYLCPYFLQI